MESYWNISEVKAVLFVIISATSYYRFLGSTPYEIACGIYSQPVNYMHMKILAYAESIWRVGQRVHNKELHGVSSP